MPRYFLTRLKVEGFRGINNEADPLDLRFREGAVNSVFAVNGIGKSSIFEALYYSIFGTIPKLQSLQAQEKPDEYYCNRFHSRQLATIELEFQPDDGGSAVVVRVERDVAGNRTATSPSGYPDPEAFLASLRETFALLDYRSFARFIEDSPLERGRTFSALLGLSEYSDRRQALQAVSETRTLNTDLEMRVINTVISSAQAEVRKALGTLRTTYQHVSGASIPATAFAGKLTKGLASARTFSCC